MPEAVGIRRLGNVPDAIRLAADGSALGAWGGPRAKSCSSRTPVKADPPCPPTCKAASGSGAVVHHAAGRHGHAAPVSGADDRAGSVPDVCEGQGGAQSQLTEKDDPTGAATLSMTALSQNQTVEFTHLKDVPV